MKNFGGVIASILFIRFFFSRGPMQQATERMVKVVGRHEFKNPKRPVFTAKSEMMKKNNYLAILCALFGKVKGPFQRF